jgi:hypothetical protein
MAGDFFSAAFPPFVPTDSLPALDTTPRSGAQDRPDSAMAAPPIPPSSRPICRR